MEKLTYTVAVEIAEKAFDTKSSHKVPLDVVDLITRFVPADRPVALLYEVVKRCQGWSPERVAGYINSPHLSPADRFSLKALNCLYWVHKSEIDKSYSDNTDTLTRPYADLIGNGLATRVKIAELQETIAKDVPAVERSGISDHLRVKLAINQTRLQMLVACELSHSKATPVARPALTTLHADNFTASL